MGTVTLLFGIHNHQPQGNFDHVFEQGYVDCYRPLLDAMARHPSLRFSVHHSGPLLEWFEDHHPDYLDQLWALGRTRQIELLGGGFYEPMLSVLPEADAQGQLRMMADYLEQHTGERPRGMWLAERVWEPGLARTIASAGYRYTLLDDGHFLAAGMQRPMRGYYVTDKAGLPLCLFPIAMELRYAIPFRPAEEAIDLLLRMADASGEQDVVVTYGDDGEKFGMWPHTKEWVWEKGWLERFLTLLEANGDRIRTATFSETLQRHRPSGLVYLPTGSYDEMGEWSLPAAAQHRLHELTETIDQQGRKDTWGPFVRGGIWQGFLARYPEANFMHKRMCFVSDRVARAVAQAGSHGALQETATLAVRELYRGQCNCAYWHGLFGGLYLGKLRSAVHTHLIRADRLAAEVLGTRSAVELELADLNGDLLDDVYVYGPELGAIVAPGLGGSLLAIDDRRRDFCVTDVLSRRPEGYHARIRALAQQASAPQEGEAPQSIHHIATLKDEGLADLLVYDPHSRTALLDHFLPETTSLGALAHGASDELGDFVHTPYQLLRAIPGDAAEISLQRQGHVRSPYGRAPVTLRKQLSVEQRRITAAYRFHTEADLGHVRFATELSLVLPSGPHPDGRLSVVSSDERTERSVVASGEASQVTRIELRDPFTPLTVALSLSPAADVAYFPLETASQSESGFERTYQGTVIVVGWRFPPGGAATFEPQVQLELL
ncbi:MAG: DUF1926 domain-containing protein [Deltaproteobacteria bacterium]|nr:DUF1926 domain-containing protein [Deltaproteobacteria bacterium]